MDVDSSLAQAFLSTHLGIEATEVVAIGEGAWSRCFGFRRGDEELVIRGYIPPLEASNWYASPEEFAAVYESAGFDAIDARLIERPTRIEHGVAEWVTTFRRGWLDRAGVPEAERAEIGAAVADRVGSDVADYVRLRFIMRKPA